MLGADLNPNQVKLVHVRRNRVEAFALLQRDQADAFEQWDAQFTGFAQRHRFIRKRLWASLEGSSVVTQIIELPLMSARERKAAINLEVEQLSSRSSGELDYDYVVLSTQGGQDRILVIANPRENSDQWLGCFDRARLGCEGITIDSLAFASCVEGCLGRATLAQQSLLLVNVSRSFVSSVLLVGGELMLLRHRALEFAVPEAKAIEPSAESFDRLVGLDETEPGGEQEDLELQLDDQPASRSRSASDQKADLAGWTTALMDHVRATVGYHSRMQSAADTKLAVYLTGDDWPADVDLPALLADQLDVTVEIFDPFTYLSCSSRLPDTLQERSAYTVAIGSAMMGAQAR